MRRTTEKHRRTRRNSFTLEQGTSILVLASCYLLHSWRATEEPLGTRTLTLEFRATILVLANFHLLGRWGAAEKHRRARRITFTSNYGTSILVYTVKLWPHVRRTSDIRYRTWNPFAFEFGASIFVLAVLDLLRVRWTSKKHYGTRNANTLEDRAATGIDFRNDMSRWRTFEFGNGCAWPRVDMDALEFRAAFFVPPHFNLLGSRGASQKHGWAWAHGHAFGDRTTMSVLASINRLRERRAGDLEARDWPFPNGEGAQGAGECQEKADTGCHFSKSSDCGCRRGWVSFYSVMKRRVLSIFIQSVNYESFFGLFCPQVSLAFLGKHLLREHNFLFHERQTRRQGLKLDKETSIDLGKQLRTFHYRSLRIPDTS